MHHPLNHKIQLIGITAIIVKQLKYNIMTQEKKDLLLKDLSARLPYGVICEDEYGNIFELNGIDKPNTVTFKCSDKTFWTTDLDGCKPYLFPMSSMTEWQDRELEILMKNSIESCGMLYPYDCLEMERFFNENHIDWRGLIPMGLAIDATNLNIY